MRIIKKLLLYTTIIGAVLLSILVVFGFLYQDKIVSSVKTEINKQLNAEIKVDNIELSFITHFPLASISLKNVTGYESKNFSNSPDTLFYFDEFSLLFDVVEVFNGKYILNSIDAHYGFLNLEIDKSGNENYLIFTSDTSSSSKFFLDLQSVKLNDCEVGFSDLTSTNKYRFFFPNLTAKGTFTDTQISTALYGNTEVISLMLDNTPYLTNELAQVDVVVEINPNTGGFQVTRGFVTLRDEYKFDVHGKSVNDTYNFSFDSKALDLKQAESLIPKKHTKFISTYDLSGVADIFLEVDHPQKGKHPLISGKFSLTKGVVKNKESGVALNISSATGKFDLGKYAAPATTTITVSAFEMATKQGHAKGEISVKNLKHPRFNLKANGKLDLLHVSTMIPQKSTIQMDGFVSFTTQLSGVIQDVDSITVNDVKTLKGEAFARFENTRIILEGIPEINSLTADVDFRRQMVRVTNMTGNVANSKTTANVDVENWVRYLIDDTTPLIITGDLKSERFDINDWTKDPENESISDASFPANLNLNVLLAFDELISQRMHVANFKARVSYKPKTLKISNATFDGYGGYLKLSLSTSERASSFYWKGRLETQNVAIEKLLKDFNNFDQTVITYQQTRGKFFSDIAFEFETNKQFDINKASLKMGGDLMLLDGELIENKLLYEIPSAIESNKIIGLFVNLDAFEKRLHDIKFDTIQNHFSIENNTLYIPQMRVKTSALSIQIMGTHTFDNEMDYYMNFNLKEVLTKKEKLTDEYGYLSEGESGGRMIYLHVYTKKGEIEVDLDKEGSKKNRNAKAKHEWTEAKSILKQEWETITNDSVTDTPTEPATFEYDVDLGEFGDDSITVDSAQVLETDSLKADSGFLKNKKSKKKKKKKKKSDFEDWDFEDDDY